MIKRWVQEFLEKKVEEYIEREAERADASIKAYGMNPDHLFTFNRMHYLDGSRPNYFIRIVDSALCKLLNRKTVLEYVKEQSEDVKRSLIYKINREEAKKQLEEFTEKCEETLEEIQKEITSAEGLKKIAEELNKLQLIKN